ncbi:MAG: SCO family protein [Rhodospirillaceae bacterium]|nr:SCO family protein [Rhodospirillaceae bacterium]
MTKSDSWKGLVVALIFAAAGLVTYIGTRDLQERPDRRDFELQSVDGRKVTLETFKGKWVLMFFGFTSCPDICPTTLTNMASTLDAMGEVARNVQPVFITIDPERDTGPVLKDYLANFGGHVVGLTGTAKQIAQAAARYQTFYSKRATDDGYTMDHSTAVELISPEGVYLRAFRPDEDPDDFAKELLTIMKKAPT